jgi:hypothetical protein
MIKDLRSIFKKPDSAPSLTPSFRILENHSQHLQQKNDIKRTSIKNIKPRLKIKNLDTTPINSTRENSTIKTNTLKDQQIGTPSRYLSELTYDVNEISPDFTYDFNKPLLALLEQAIKLRKGLNKDYKTAIYILELTLRSIQPGSMRFKYQCELANSYKINQMHKKSIDILTEMRKVYTTNQQRKEIHAQLKSTHESNGDHLQALIHKSFIIALELNNLRTVVLNIESNTDISATMSPAMYKNTLKNNKSYGITESGYKITDKNWAIAMDKIDNILCVETLSRKLIDPTNKITSMLLKKACILKIHKNLTENRRIKFDDLASTIKLSAA